MSRAIELSLRNVVNGKGGPFAAVIVKDGKIIAEGVNHVTIDNDPTAHAEIVAIRKACQAIGHFQLQDCEIYTSCEPCPMCMGAIYWARPAKVYYGNTKRDAARIGFDDSLIYAELRRPLSRRLVTMVPLMRREAQKAFQAWKQKVDKVEY